jgi:hypothetical protein
MLLGFMVLVVPVAVSALETPQTLSMASRVYDKRLEGQYNASTGVEAAIFEIMSDPTFDDDLNLGSPDKDIVVTTNGEIVTVTITKNFTTGLTGQGLVLTKVVSPTSTAVSTPTTFT